MCKTLSSGNNIYNDSEQNSVLIFLNLQGLKYFLSGIGSLETSYHTWIL